MKNHRKTIQIEGKKQESQHDQKVALSLHLHSPNFSFLHLPVLPWEQGAQRRFYCLPTGGNETLSISGG